MEALLNKSPKKLHSQQTVYSQDDAEFMKAQSQLLYKTTSSKIGKETIKAETNHGMNGKFTDHLAGAGMFRNRGLNTVAERDRYLNGCRDWEQKLG